MQQVIKTLSKRYDLKLQREKIKMVININFAATMNQHIQVIIMLCSLMVSMHNPNTKADFFDCKNT